MRNGTTITAREARQINRTFGGGRAANPGGRRPRDSQKTKVYKAGWAAQRGTAGGGHVMPLHAVRVYASELWEAAGQPSETLPRITVSGRRSNSCTSSAAGISMAADMCTPQVISHELSHSLLRLSQPEVWRGAASHGPEFCRTWLNMLTASKLELNNAMAAELVRQFTAHNVKVQRLTASEKRGAKWVIKPSAPVSVLTMAGEPAPPAVATAVAASWAGRLLDGEGWSAAQELARRQANRAAKRTGGTKVEFPKNADPALFQASAAELREMS